MNEYLTLAIRETNPFKPKSDFEILVMDKETRKIQSFELKKDEIVAANGEVFWDIGFVTMVRSVREVSGGLKPSGFMRIYDASTKLKSLLDTATISSSRFFTNTSEKFAVVKVDKVLNISCGENDRGIFQSRIKVKLNGVPTREKEQELLNKDYRWLKYWQHIKKVEKTDEKIAQYLSLLNKSDKDLYLILYRHTFKNKRKMHWIAGMHWL